MELESIIRERGQNISFIVEELQEAIAKSKSLDTEPGL